MNAMAFRIFGGLGLSVTLAACGSLGSSRSPSAAIYDLGLSDAVTRQESLLPASVEVRAPSWLAGTAMQYRLEYVQPAPRQAYLESRWASPPAELLEVNLRRMLPPNGKSACRLRVDLDEFAQVYKSQSASQAVVAARIELLAPRGDTVVARSDLNIAEQAANPDAAAGVIAHRRAVQRLAEEIAAWLARAAAANESSQFLLQACSKSS